MDLYDKVEPLAKKDLLLLGAFIESFGRRTLRDIQNIISLLDKILQDIADEVAKIP